MAYFVIFAKTKTMKNGNWVFWLIGLGSLALMAATLFYNYTYATGLACDQQGVFGDMFGASNAFFTGLSFTGVIIAILLQRQELKFQREELELTRKEMELTRDEFIAQNETLVVQRFENTFFNLLHARNEMISNYEITFGNSKFSDGQPEIFKGRQLLVKIYGNFLQHSGSSIEGYKTAYPNIYKNNQILSLMYRSLSQILKLVDEHVFSENISDDFNTKKKYVDILRDQLTDQEIAFVLYECIIGEQSNLVKQYIEKYSFLEYINDDLVWKPHKSHFTHLNL